MNKIVGFGVRRIFFTELILSTLIILFLFDKKDIFYVLYKVAHFYQIQKKNILLFFKFQNFRV